MNYTIVVDEAERDKRIENRLNALLRRCRIGKVVKKQDRSFTPVLAPQFPPISVPKLTPLFSFPETTDRKCSCAPGTACGNVACPYRLIVTC